MTITTNKSTDTHTNLDVHTHTDIEANTNIHLSVNTRAHARPDDDASTTGAINNDIDTQIMAHIRTTTHINTDIVNY